MAIIGGFQYMRRRVALQEPLLLFCVVFERRVAIASSNERALDA